MQPVGSHHEWFLELLELSWWTNSPAVEAVMMHCPIWPRSALGMSCFMGCVGSRRLAQSCQGRQVAVLLEGKAVDLPTLLQCVLIIFTPIVFSMWKLPKMRLLH